MDYIAERLRMKNGPIAIYRTDSIPEGSEPVADTHCAISMLFVPSMMERRSVYASADMIQCDGAISGLCFGREGDRDMLPVYYAKTGYFDSEDRCRRNYTDVVPFRGERSGYVVFEPLETALSRGAEPLSVVYLADPARLSALTYLAGYARDTPDSPVLMRYSFACEQLLLLPVLESEREQPRAVIGMTEFFARKFVGRDEMTFSVPYSLYKVMISNAEASFLKNDRLMSMISEP